MKKSKIYMIIAIAVLISSLLGSYAWYEWESTTNNEVSLGVCIPEISFIGGETLNGDDLMPTKDKINGLTKEVKVTLSKICKEGDSGVMNLYMTLDFLPTELQEESFVYEIWNEDEKISSGNFADTKEGYTITLLTNQVITDASSTYVIYVYIDGNMDNPYNMSNKSFRFSIYSVGTGAIYEENTIANFTTPSNSSSTFLNSGLARKDIESITIAEDNTVPEGIEAVPLSSVESDDSIMLWYTDIDENDLYEVYIGSDNGIVKLNNNATGLFAYLTKVESLDLTNIDTSNVTNMTNLFRGNTNLKELKISNFDTSNVKLMNYMFYGCSNLINLDLNNFDTSYVTNMIGMFRDCSSLTNLNLSGFNTSNVKNMNSMFNNCRSLTSLVLDGFDTSLVETMTSMFGGCTSLRTLDVTDLETDSVTTMSSMFYNCSSLESIDISGFNTSNVTGMSEMFHMCSSLTSLDLSNLDFSNLIDARKAFNTTSLTSIDLSGVVISGITNYSEMFQNTSNLTVIVDSSQVDWVTSNFNKVTVEEA